MSEQVEEDVLSNEFYKNLIRDCGEYIIDCPKKNGSNIKDCEVCRIKYVARKAYEQSRKETFMEIMEMLRFGYELPIDDIAREMAKEYGVEVCGD